MANIRLNIIPVSNKYFSYKIFRKLKKQDEIKEDGLYLYDLPKEEYSKERQSYWVSFIPRNEFEEFTVHSTDIIGLSKKFLLNQLVNTIANQEIPFQYNVENRFTDDYIYFIIESFSEGNRIISMSPYYLEEQNIYGFIIDFKFDKNKDTPFDKNVQILSLSLDAHGRSNKNYYSDKYNLIQKFLGKIYDKIQNIGVSDQPIQLRNNLVETTVFHLNKKEYIFNNGNTANSQFQGIRNFGPYLNVNKEVIFAFIFEERFKSFANELYLSLTGKLNPGTFPGLEQMFGININVKNVIQIKIENYTKTELLQVVENVKNLQDNNPEKKVIGIYIEDCAIDIEDIPASNHYYFLKYNFIKNSLPLQVVNYRKLSERNSLKWSTSNIALAMFAKMGGIPWVVKPSNKDCLILGVGSSHKINKDTKEITKYFAYTVCLDSSGLYKTLEVLADEESETSYLEKLTNSLVNILNDSKKNNYKTCALHLPFKIKKKEISAISEAIKQVDNIELIVIKININNKYFGYSFHNTLVPYESSFVKLSRNEYLVWFEGLLYGKEIVDKRLSNPVHIQFLNSNTEKNIDEHTFLQDILNVNNNRKVVHLVIEKYTTKCLG
ncbi:MAG: Piwi domain-containing protein [Dysgonomonas sp.]|nr:Piwi domain-containing protein [Dysgonomonas sp.]